MKLPIFLLILWGSEIAGQVPISSHLAASLGQEVFGNGSTDVFSFIRNSAALTRSGKGVGVYAEKKYLMRDLHVLLVAASMQHRKDGLGVWAGWQGSPMLSRFTAAIAFGKALGKVDAGMQLSFQSLLQRGYGNHSAVQSSAGLVWSMSSVFKSAIQVDHFLPGGEPPTGTGIHIRWGWGYQCSPQVLLWVQAGKAASFPISWEGGLQYDPDERFRISGGWRGQAFSPWLGCSWHSKGMVWSVYGSMHPVLGFTPVMQWGVNEKRKQ